MIEPSNSVEAVLRQGAPRITTRLQLTRGEAQLVFSTLTMAASLLALLALADLALRAAVRLEVRWDTFAYHLPYAALRSGLSMSYELSDKMRPPYEGFPPLADFVQGMLWRLTGSMNATGVVNYLALAGFLTFCQRALRAPFWLVALISLTAPLVVIHASTSYVDLFGNSFLAAGACACLSVFLFPVDGRRAVLAGGLVALAAAAWCKYTLVPVVALVLIVFTVLALRRPTMAGFSRWHAALLCMAATTLAAAVYIKNWVVYGNPFWPIRLPFVGDLFPYTSDAMKQGALVERPQSLIGHGQVDLFFRSLFEINLPTSYLWRPRWIIDQGDSEMFRMGGFWNVAVGFYLVTVMVMLVACNGRRGMLAGAGIMAMLGLVALLPQSHELRYFQFIPLTGAATIGLLFPQFKEVAPRAALTLIAIVMGLFLHMVAENWAHYRIERIDQAAAAEIWGATAWWPKLERGRAYCAVGMVPMAMLLTGPTLSEYHIVDRSRAALCPPGSEIITR